MQQRPHLSLSQNGLVPSLLLVFAMALLAAAMRPRGGYFNLAALPFLAASLIFLSLVVFLVRKVTRIENVSDVVASDVLCSAMKLALLWQLWIFAVTYPWYWGVAVLVALVVALDFSDATIQRVWAQKETVRKRVMWWQKSRSLLILTIFSGLCLYQLLLQNTPRNDLPDRVADVYVFQAESSRALLAGNNPYTLTFRNIYSHDEFYGAGLVKSGQLQFGYVYMPLTLLMAVPGYLLGDVRLALFAAVLVSGAILMAIKPSRLSLVAATLLLFSPFCLTVIRTAWTDPFVVVTFCGVLWCAVHRPTWLAYAVGLWLASKQYVVLLLPLAWLLLPAKSSWREQLRFFGKALATALVVTLPMVLWNVSAFVHSAIALQFVQPFRGDSLSFLVVYKMLSGVQPAFWVPFVFIALATVLALRCAPRAPSGFALSVAFVFLVFVAFNKQSFMNYYFVVFGALCGTLATWDLFAEISKDEAAVSMPLVANEIAAVEGARHAGKH